MQIFVSTERHVYRVMHEKYFNLTKTGERGTRKTEGWARNEMVEKCTVEATMHRMRRCHKNDQTHTHTHAPSRIHFAIIWTSVLSACLSERFTEPNEITIFQCIRNCSHRAIPSYDQWHARVSVSRSEFISWSSASDKDDGARVCCVRMHGCAMATSSQWK